MYVATLAVAMSCAMVSGESLCTVNDFSDTGCALETRAEEPEPASITLKSTRNGLEITVSNESFNCAITLVGLACDATVEGNVINYRVFENGEATAKCMCPVKSVKGTISGLSRGDYLFVFNDYLPISFRYSSSLDKTYLLSDYAQ